MRNTMTTQKTKQASLLEVNGEPLERIAGTASRRRDRGRYQTVEISERPDDESMKMYSMRLPQALVAELKAVAKAKSFPYQALARVALAEFVAKNSQKDGSGAVASPEAAGSEAVA